MKQMAKTLKENDIALGGKETDMTLKNAFRKIQNMTETIQKLNKKIDQKDEKIALLENDSFPEVSSLNSERAALTRMEKEMDKLSRAAS